MGDREPPTDRPESRASRTSLLKTDVHARGSRAGAVFQRLRNPSTRTGILLLIAAVLLVSAPFIPQWVRNTQDGLDARREAQERFESGLISETLLIPSQVLPYLNRRVAQMANAETPEQWNAISFAGGPCSPPHFAQIPDGKYKAALQVGCGEIQAIQQEYSQSCIDAATCEIPLAARDRLLASIEKLYAEFADSGLVLPYTYEEQVIGP